MAVRDELIVTNSNSLTPIVRAGMANFSLLGVVFFVGFLSQSPLDLVMKCSVGIVAAIAVEYSGTGYSNSP